MKRFALLIGLIVIIATTTEAQQSSAFRSWVNDSTTATTSWDSVYLGGSHGKYVTVDHDGTSGVLLYAQENDTTYGKYGMLRVINSSPESDTFYSVARWLRTKAQSGTIARRVKTSQTPPVVK